MKIKKRHIKIFVALIAFVLGYFFYSEDGLSKNFKSVSYVQNNQIKEKDYVQKYCKGTIEYVLSDKTRVDCLTDEYAIEYDWAHKWAESVGQSLYYARMTGLKPAVAIILKRPEDEKYIKRIELADERITIFKIKAYE